MVLSLLFKPKQLKMVLALMREAKRRGVSAEQLTDSLTPEELVALVRPEKNVPDVRRWGLPADEEITGDAPAAAPEIAAAIAALRAGDWEPAADVLAGIGTDWDRRASVVAKLGDVLADDDSALKAWQAAKPGDPDAAVVHASSLVSLAWQIRGASVAEHVGHDQFAAFFRVLEEAEQVTRAATRAAPADPTPWYTLLNVSMGRQAPAGHYREVWAELVARDPLHRAGHGAALQYWCAKWHGSHDEMFAFAEAAAAKAPKLAALELVAAHEAEDDRPAWKAERVGRALDRLLPWLDGEGRDHPSARADRAYVAKAFVERKRFDEAVEQFRLLGVHAEANVWQYSGAPRAEFRRVRYQACRGASKP